MSGSASTTGPARDPSGERPVRKLTDEDASVIAHVFDTIRARVARRKLAERPPEQSSA